MRETFDLKFLKGISCYENDVSDFCDILHSSKMLTHIYESPPPLVSIKYIVVITTVTPTLNIENIPASSSPNPNAVVIPNQTLNNPKIIPGEISIVAAIPALFMPSVFFPPVLILTSPPFRLSSEMYWRTLIPDSIVKPIVKYFRHILDGQVRRINRRQSVRCSVVNYGMNVRSESRSCFPNANI